MPKVVLMSRQPLTKRPLQKWLDDTANTIVLITSRSAVEGSQDVLAEHFPNHRLVDDYSSWSTDRVAEEAARACGADLVASTSEQDVLRAARLRVRLGLTGQLSDSATAYRDKVIMKRLARRAGLGVPEFTAVDDAMDLLDFIDAQGFPIVVKPRSGVGAIGVSMLHDPHDVDDFMGRQRMADPPYLPGQWMAEAFVRGDFFHVDGIMRNGKIVHGWPSQYSGGLAEYLRDRSPFLSSVLLAPDDDRTAVLMGLTEDVIATLPSAPLPLAFHCEAWIGSDGRPILCEIASRAGGPPIPDAYRAAFGVHLSREALRAQCGSDLTVARQPQAPEPASGWIQFPPQHGRFMPPASSCPIPGVDLAITMTSGAESAGVSDLDDMAASAIVTGSSAAQVRQRIELAAQWWAQNTTWARSGPHDRQAV
jgi:hypothetical protein